MSIELSESTQMCSKDNMRERERKRKHNNWLIGNSDSGSVHGIVNIDGGSGCSCAGNGIKTG